MDRRQAARSLDRDDPLRSFRDAFVIADPDLVYLDGNSLGRLPRATVDAVRRVVEEEWGGELVLGWDRWLHLGLETGDRLAPLIGAGSGEVAVCDQTSVNLYKLAAAALAATSRTDIVTDAGNFPSDRYVLESVARSRGGTVRVIDEDPGPQDVAEALDDSVALVALTHVAYRSGAILDMEAITAAAHRAGALALWDLSHAAGSVPIHLAGCAADLAVGCTYKYLNGGPGSPAFLYVRRALQAQLEQPIAGWFAHADQFAFDTDFRPADDIRRFTVGTPPILSMVGAAEGIALTAGAGIERIRDKSLAMTTRFVAAVDELPIELTSPREPERRGSHVTLRHPAGWQISQDLRARRVIVDFRAPDLIRFGFAPLYNTFAEVEVAAAALADVLGTESYLAYPSERTAVT